MSRTILTVLLGAGLFAGIPAGAQNLLQNPGFETGTDGSGFPLDWDGISAFGPFMNGTLDSGTVRTGSFSFRFDIRNSVTGPVQSIRTPKISSSSPFGTSVNAGDFIEFSGWILNNAADPMQGGANGQLILEFQNAGGTSAGSFTSSAWGAGLSTTDWVEFTTGQLVVPASYALFRVENFTGFQEAGSFFVDDLAATLTPVPEISGVLQAVFGALFVGFYLLVRRSKPRA
jgi:hypothetical protein